MSTLVICCKKVIKQFVDYRIENDRKIYTLRHTPFRVSYSLKRVYEKNWANCKVIENKIVFDNYMGKSYGCNSKYVTEELLKRPGHFDIVWTVKNKAEVQMDFPKGVRLVEYGSKEAYEEYATAKVWIGNYHLVAYLNKGLMKKPEQTYIQMWHGSFGIKKIENDCGLLTADQNWTYLAKKNSEYTDYWISNSEFETQVYRSSFWNVKTVLPFGHPRNDLFYAKDSNTIKAKVWDYFSVCDKKLMLYVPTYRDDGLEEATYPDYKMILDSLEQRFGGEWILLVRLHPRMASQSANLIKHQENVLDATRYPDIQELLACADSVLTDYSSSIFDFILSGKPGFLYANDIKEYEQGRGLYYPLTETPFQIAGNNEELQNNILSFDEVEYKKKVARFLEDKRSVEDGNAAKRVADLIENIVKKERMP